MATVTQFAGTGAGTNWTTPGNITADDNAYAWNITGLGVYDALKATNFGFAIPAGATVDNLSLIMGRFSVGEGIIDNSVRWTKDNVSTVGADIDAGMTWNPTTEREDTLTGLGGSSFTPAEINSANFGAWIVCQGTGESSEADVDYVKVTVDYTPAAASFTAQVMVFCLSTIARSAIALFSGKPRLALDILLSLKNYPRRRRQVTLKAALATAGGPELDDWEYQWEGWGEE